MPGGIRIDVDDAQVRRALQRLREHTRDLEPALDAVGRRLMTSIDQRFRSGTAPDGSPWRPLRYRQGQPLVDSGRLRQSITRRVFSDAVEVGTNVVYAAIHQFGGRTPPRTIRPRTKQALYWPGARHPVKSVRHPGSVIPARPFLGVSRGDEAAITRILQAHIEAAWT